jgi:predicted chitinase
MGNRLPIEGYRALFPAMNAAMLEAECTTVNRAAGMIAQFGHESGGLRWMEELASGEAYNGRVKDLGNTEPGDGPRFKGRGPIQVTGRGHYAALSRWAFDRQLVPTATYFVDNPAELASPKYGFIGGVWYWLTHTRRDDNDGVVRHLNDYCDRDDIVGMTRAVNGGTRGLEDPFPAGRRALYEHAKAMGDAILPTSGVAAPPRPVILPRPDWRGDPVFLPEVLRLFGVTPVEFPGWRDRGHGDFGAIGWVLWHHTGNRNERPDTIAKHPTLGLAANIHIAPDGVVTLCGAGIAWHGGEGIYPGIPEDGINQVSIGVECAYGPNFNDPWPDAQVDSMIRVGAAITWYLGLQARNNIAHKEWAGADNPLGINKQGKPDPANFNMGWFRDMIGHVAAAGPNESGDDDMSDPVVVAAARKILAMGDDNVVRPWASRARTRPDNRGVDDTTGMDLWTHGDVYDLLTAYSAIEFADPDCIARLEALAQGTGPGAKYPDGSPDTGAMNWAAGVLRAVAEKRRTYTAPSGVGDGLGS